MSDGDENRSTSGGRDGDSPSEPESDRVGETNPDHPAVVDREFDWRGWSLVAAIFVAFLVIPGLIYAYPHVPSSVGLSFWDTYLVLPMIPAVVLGLLAVWATTRP